MTRRGFALAVLALLGITLAVALTWTIGQLAGQHIGLASAPPSVIRGLAPSPGPAERPERAPKDRAVSGTETRNRPSVTAAPAAVLPATVTAVGPVTHAPVPAASPTAMVTVTQASTPATTAPARPAGGSPGGGDNGNGPGDSGRRGSSGPGGSPHSGNGRDD